MESYTQDFAVLSSLVKCYEYKVKLRLPSVTFYLFNSDKEQLLIVKDARLMPVKMDPKYHVLSWNSELLIVFIVKLAAKS